MTSNRGTAVRAISAGLVAVTMSIGFSGNANAAPPEPEQKSDVTVITAADIRQQSAPQLLVVKGLRMNHEDALRLTNHNGRCITVASGDGQPDVTGILNGHTDTDVTVYTTRNNRYVQQTIDTVQNGRIIRTILSTPTGCPTPEAKEA